MTNSELATAMLEADLRAETVIHLASQVVDEALPREVQDAFEADLIEIAPLLGLDPTPVCEDTRELSSSLSDIGKFGFLVRMATPVPRRMTATSYHFSWGCYQCRWFYGESLDDIYADALRWHTEYIAEQRADAGF